MIKNYLKTTFRKLWSRKAFSFINIIGLAIGMTACFLIYLFVNFELSYDKFHTKADRIYRVVADIKTPSEVIHGDGPSWAVAPKAKDEFPEVEAYVRISGDNMLIRKGNVKFQEQNLIYADSAFFKIFDFKLLKGNPQAALKDQLSVVFSETAAKKYFGNSDPVGQTLLLTGNALPAKVTGVMKDLPENSIIKADVIVSMSTLTKKFDPNRDNQWGNYGNNTFLLLKPGVNPKTLEAKFTGFLERRNGDEMKQHQMFPTLFLEPLRDVYLRSTRGASKTGNINNVYIFSIIAIFILLIACINFINLTTARSLERAKEVGIRKVAGADKLQLISQFIGESVIVCLIAFLLTIIFSALLLPLFNQLAGKTISNGIFHSGYFVFQLFLASIVIGLLAGIYPALVLTSFQPVVVLKGRFATSSKGVIMRKSLVIAQFTISIALIIATIVVYNQMTYMRNQDLGFSRNQILIFDSHGDPGKKAFQEAVANLQSVKSTSTSSSVPGGGNPGAYSEIENSKSDLQVANLDLYFVDFDYIKQFKMKMVAGRGFSKDFKTDTTQAMVLNETAVEMFGYSSPDQAIGKRFKQWGREGKIIGVIKDFHFKSLQQPIQPLSMRIEPTRCDLITLNVSATNLPATLAAIKKDWETFIPNIPFSYSFLDEFFNKQYSDEEKFGKLFLNFAVLAILISCLGLLGLSSYTTTQRTKEIGIRKVLGASVSNILNLLSTDFLKLVIISFAIAAPLAWYFMHNWLQNFAYHTNINAWVFASAGFCAFAVALFTISFQAIKAALANPVKSLRSE